jgi:hypothetical protein
MHSFLVGLADFIASIAPLANPHHSPAKKKRYRADPFSDLGLN